MHKYSSRYKWPLPVLSSLLLASFGCGSGGSDGSPDNSQSEPSTSDDAGSTSSKKDAGSTKDAGGSSGTTHDAGKTGTSTAHDSGVQTFQDAGGTHPAGDGGAGAADAGHSSDAGAAHLDGAVSGSSDASSGGGTTSLMGTLGSLGAVQPTVSSLYISYSGETIVYLISAPFTCAQMQQSRWLGSLPSGTQVVEVIVKGAPVVGTAVQVGLFAGEVNYAPGGMSSAYEQNASSGTITYTKSTANGPVEADFSATYPMGNVMGTFHAEFCQGGQEY
ncbi:MAG TPA: hypothetical protein VG963_27610 [Polyangiaceae bacterium]|nr:hypothetical protein [Polyangiaceae bacterium]